MTDSDRFQSLVSRNTDWHALSFFLCAREIQRQKRICFTDTDCLLLVLSPRDWYTKDIYESARRDFGKKSRHKYPHLALKRILFRSPSESVNRTLFIFGPRFCGWRLRKTFDLIKKLWPEKNNEACKKEKKVEQATDQSGV